MIADLNQHLSHNDRKILFDNGGEFITSDQIPNCVRMSKPKAVNAVQQNCNISFEDEMNNEIKSHIQTQFSKHFRAQTVEEKVSTIVDMKLFEPSTSKTQKDIDDELLYDPDADDEDERWMKSKITSDNVTSDKKRKKAFSSDKKDNIVLNCPCCMTLLCVDCQQHDIYDGQFRAMFVQNCRVDYKQRLTIRNKHEQRDKFRKSVQKRAKEQEKKLPQKDAKNDVSTEQEDPETSQKEPECNLYYPVHCSDCHTQIALYDCEEVYHFFSVISSS